MSRRPGNTGRRLSESDSFPFGVSTNKKSQTSPLLSIGLVVLGAFLLIGYSYKSSGGLAVKKEISLLGGGASCTLEVLKAVTALKNAYGASMDKVLHVGPETCSVISEMKKQDVSEVWGMEPYDIEETNNECKSLVRKGLVRFADIKFPLPYQPKSFSLVIVSDTLDYLSPKYINTTLLELTRVSKDGLVIFTGLPGQHRMKVAEQAKFGKMAKLRSLSWWKKYFLQIGLEEDETRTKKFKTASSKSSYAPNCQIFHLSS